MINNRPTIPQMQQDAVRGMEKAYQKIGAYETELHSKGSAFYQALTYGNLLEEPRLRLRLAVSSGSRESMKELWHILFQSGDTIGRRHERLDSWMQNNRSLMGWMSEPMRNMIKDVASQKGLAEKIETAANRAEDAVRKAFGNNTKADSPDTMKSIESLRYESKTEGAVQWGYGNRVSQLAPKLVQMFFPGAKAALAELQTALSDPNASNIERRDRLENWMQKNPSLVKSLDFGVLLGLRRDLSVADWSDNNRQKARDAVLSAFGS